MRELLTDEPAFPSMPSGSTFDLVEDEHGAQYNFLLAEGRQRCRVRLRAERPWLAVGSPPCTWWSTLMARNAPTMPKDEAARRETEARTLPSFARDVSRCQLNNGCHFLH